MRFVLAIVVALAASHTIAAAADAAPRLDAALVREGYALVLEHESDGSGEAVYALKAEGKSRRGWGYPDRVTANYLFVDRKTGAQRWLFAENQECIWRMMYFAADPRKKASEPAMARAVVYDVTPSGELDDWGRENGMEGFRFCTGTNPCLPLRRIFISKPDGRKLTALTTTFQILDNDYGQASVAQRGGTIVVSRVYHSGEAVAFDLETFALVLGGGSQRLPKLR